MSGAGRLKTSGEDFQGSMSIFDYTIRETGEIISLNHRWVYSPSEAPEEIVYEKEPIGARQNSNRGKGGSCLLFLLCLNLKNMNYGITKSGEAPSYDQNGTSGSQWLR